MMNKEMTRDIIALVALLVFQSCWAPEARSQPISRNLFGGLAVLTVGPGKDFSTIAAAVAAAQNGDTIKVQDGTYINDYVSIDKNITLQGVGGMVEMVSTGLIPNGKAIVITNGDITINNFAFSRAQVTNRNGAGIRYERGNLILNNCHFYYNENGLLSAADATGSIKINHSEFAYNGYGDGYTHNLYVGHIADLTIDRSYFHDANVGHEIKSRSLNTTIRNSRIYDRDSTASYSINLPNGGDVVIQNNEIEQGSNSQNFVIISYGEEGNLNPGTNFVVSDNTIVNHKLEPALAVRNSTTAIAQITNNEFFGLTSNQIASGPNVQSSNRFLVIEPILAEQIP
jgi:hypothetical protein